MMTILLPLSEEFQQVLIQRVWTRPLAALESVPKIRMFIPQFHPLSQAAIFILVVFFQQFLPSPNAGL
jgi:hypothetical protein